MIRKYKAKIDCQYRDAAGKIRSYQAGAVLVWKEGMPVPSRHFELIDGGLSPAPPVIPPLADITPPDVNPGVEPPAVIHRHPPGRPKTNGAAK